MDFRIAGNSRFKMRPRFSINFFFFSSPVERPSAKKGHPSKGLRSRESASSGQKNQVFSPRAKP
jgi:hypothetical protein